MIDLVGHRNLTDLLRERTSAHQDKPWLVFESADGSVAAHTYGQFQADVIRVAGGLRSLGVSQGDAVVVHLRNSPEFLLLLFGLARLGAVIVPSNVANTAPEVEHLLDHASAMALVTESPYLEQLLPVARQRSQVKHVILARGGTAPEGVLTFDEIPCDETTDPPLVDSEDVFQLLFTSGTTAKPKAVMLTHANALRSGEQVAKSLALDSNDRCLTALPMFHVNAQSLTLLPALTVGGTCVLLEEYRASRFWSQIRAHGATQTSIVAMLLRTLLAQPSADTDRDHKLRRVIYAINVADAEKETFEDRFAVQLLNAYGLSEAMTVVTMLPVFGERRWPSIGLPLIDRLVKIADEDGNECPPGVVGEILVHGIPGRTIMKGYFHDPEETAKALTADGWLRTGDNAYADTEGYLYFFDRKKDMIKRAGENISASEVETAIVEHPAILEAAVIGVPDDIRDEAVKAFVVVEQGQTLTSADIQAHCAERLSKFKVPTIIEFLDSLPKTSIGKIEKKALRSPTE